MGSWKLTEGRKVIRSRSAGVFASGILAGFSVGGVLLFAMGAVFLFFAPVPSVSAEEYWRDYFHFTDGDNFDGEAQMFSELSKSEARKQQTYTVVSRGEDGRILEAMTMLEEKPNYYYAYFYNENGDPVLRKMNAFLEEGETPMSKVVYSYSGGGSLVSSAYYSFNYFSGKWKVKYLKQYSGGSYRIFDYTPKEENRELEKKLERVNRRLEELQELEERNFLKKMLGIR